MVFFKARSTQRWAKEDIGWATGTGLQSTPPKIEAHEGREAALPGGSHACWASAICIIDHQRNVDVAHTWPVAVAIIDLKLVELRL